MENTKALDSGRTFSFGVIPPLKAVAIEITLVSVLGEPLMKSLMTAASMDKKKGAKKVEQERQFVEVLGMAVGVLTAKLDADEITALMKTCFEYVGIESEKHKMAQIHNHIDEVFLGHNREIWMVLFYSLRFNFQDFFPASLFASLKSKIPTEFASLNPLT
jgi:hypothetical protein